MSRRSPLTTARGMERSSTRERTPLGPRQRWLSLGLVLFGLAGSPLGCAGRDPVALDHPEAVDRAIAQAEQRLARDPEDIEARRDLAHLLWLHRGDVAAARPHLEALSGAGDPVGLASSMIVARGRQDAEGVWSSATALLGAACSVAKDASGEGRAITLALAEPAARLLDEVVDEVVDGDQRALEFLRALDKRGLPGDLRQSLEGLEAGIERRWGEDYLDNYARQGCVQGWTMGPIEGSLGALELGLLPPEAPFTSHSEAQAAALSCAVRVWNETPRAGIRRMRAEVDVPGDQLQIDLAGEEPLRLYVDGQLVARSDGRDRWPAGHQRFDLTLSPGTHQLELRVAIPESNAWILLRATDGEGLPVPTRPASQTDVVSQHGPIELRPRTAPWPEAPTATSATRRAERRGRRGAAPRIDGPVFAPLRHYLAVEDALARGDSDRAEGMASALEDAGFAEAHLLLAEFEKADPSRAAGTSRARYQRRLERALELDPGLDRARIQQLKVELDRGRTAEVLAAVEALPPGSLDDLEGELLRFAAYMERGNEIRAEQALDRLEARIPGACDLLVARRRLADRRNQVRLVDEITEALGRCAGSQALRARLATERGRYDEAAARWTERLEAVPDDVEALEALARVEILRGRVWAAREALERALRYAPFRSSARVALADLVASTGDTPGARAHLRQAIADLPHSSRLREIGETVGIRDELMDQRVDGAAAIARYREAVSAGEVDYEGSPEVLVLDRDVAEIYPTGGARHVVHQVVHLTSKESLDRYGEVPTPDDGRLLTLHTFKADGRVVEPESIPGKDGLSLRQLEVGDYVELEYLIDVEPTGLLPGYVDLARFRFQDLTTPYHHSELVVLHPEQMPVVFERRNPTAEGAPEVSRGREGGRSVLRFVARRMPRLAPEPQARSMIDELPMVRVYTALDVGAWLRTVELQIASAQRTNPELRASAESLAAGAANQAEIVDRLWSWAMKEIEEGGNMAAPATATLAARQGNRLMLLRAMLRHLGVRSELWLARDRFGPRVLPDGHPSVESYEAPMLAVWPDGAASPTMLLATSRVMPIGYLTPGFSGADGLRVPLAEGEGPAGAVKLPNTPAKLADRRSYTLELELDREGDGELWGHIELQGMEAIIWRDALMNFDRDRLPEVFQQAELQRIAPGAMLDLDEIEIEGEEALEAPLRLRFRASVSGLGARQGDDLVLPSGLVSMNLGLGLTQIPERWSALVIPYSPRTEATITLRVRDGVVGEAPPDRELDDPRGRYLRRVVPGKDAASLRIETRGELGLGMVEPADYAAFGAFTRRIDQSEQELIRIRPGRAASARSGG